MARSTMASRAAISQRRPTRLASARPTTPSRGLIATQSAGRHRFVGALDVHPLRFDQHHGVLDQPRGRLRQHHPARRAPPIPSAARTRRSRRSRRSPSDPEPMSPAITRPEFRPTRNCRATPSRRCTSAANRVRLLLDGQCGKACSKSVILQRNRGAEQRHHPVAVVLHGSAVALHHRRRPLHELGHDLAQSLDIEGGRDVHRPHHIGEQHRHLLVLGRSGCLRESRHRTRCRTCSSNCKPRRRSHRSAPPRSVPHRG